VVLLASAGVAWYLVEVGPDRAGGIKPLLPPAAALAAVGMWRLWDAGPGAAAGAELTDALDRAVAGLARAQEEQWAAQGEARRLEPSALPIRWRAVSPAVDTDRTIDQLADRLLGPGPARGLLVLGRPGAGKTNVARELTVRLLRRRVAADPVPVLLPVTDLNQLSPNDWVAERLVAAYECLGRPVVSSDGVRRNLAQELVATGRILPVLDGSDVLPVYPDGRFGVVEAAEATGRPFVVTGGTPPGAATAAGGGAGSASGTPTIELLPADLGDVARFLVAGTEGPTGRWSRVVAHLNDHPGADTPLAAALGNPLVASLAREVYRPAGAEPDELLTCAWAATPAEIGTQLLNAYVPAAFGTAVGGHPARTPRQVRRVGRWLATLARAARADGERDVAWWRLHRAVPEFALSAVAVAAFLLVAVSTIALLLLFRSAFGLTSGFSFSFAFGAGYAFGRADRPGRSGADHLPRHVEPADLLAADRARGLRGGLVVGLLLAVAYLVGSWIGVTREPLTGVLEGVVAVAGYALGTAWGIFCVTRLLLAVSGRAPLRLMTFLGEARDRGVLHRADGRYRFRHETVQDHLAEPREPAVGATRSQ